MQNIPYQHELGPQSVPTTKPIQTIDKTSNNRYLNPSIYSMFLQKRCKDCLQLINSCQPDEFKLYIKAMIERYEFRLQNSLDLLTECHLMSKFNLNCLKSIAKTYYLLGKYKSSMQVGKDAYKLDNKDYEIFYILGKISLALGDKKTAQANFKNSLHKQLNKQSFMELGNFYLQQNQPNQAIDILKQCINFAPDNPQVYELLAKAHNIIGKKQQATAFYAIALQKDPERCDALIGQGILCLDNNDVDESFEYLKKAYSASPNSVVLWNGIGMNLYRKKKLISAYSCFKRALFLDPLRWGTHSNIAIVFMAKKKYLQAAIHLRCALKLKRDSKLFNLLGMCLCELKDFINSQKSFQQALKLNPINQQINYNYMVFLYKKGDKSQAKTYYSSLSMSVNDKTVKENLIKLRSKFQ